MSRFDSCIVFVTVGYYSCVSVLYAGMATPIITYENKLGKIVKTCGKITGEQQADLYYYYDLGLILFIWFACNVSTCSVLYHKLNLARTLKFSKSKAKQPLSLQSVIPREQHTMENTYKGIKRLFLQTAHILKKQKHYCTLLHYILLNYEYWYIYKKNVKT